MRVVVGILAAGASTRMRGRDKLLEEIDGEPLLARQIRTAAALGHPVLVAVAPGPGPRRQLAEAARATVVEVADAATGMGASIAALAEAAGQSGADALLLVLADMPEIEAGDLAAVVAAAEAPDAGIVRAGTAEGQPGHPVLFPRDCFEALRTLSGDRGARDLLAAAPRVSIVPLPGTRALTDLDTPEAWAAWRAARPRR